MLKFLTAAAAVLTVALLVQPAKSAVIADLGVNPNSGNGAFNNSVGGALFSDQYTFQLVGGPQFVTIASATNVYPATTDFITGFSASVFLVVGAIGGGDDVRVLGPAGPSACLISPNCQVIAGSALLNPGNYYLDISGQGGGTSGYGGNLAVAPVPAGILGGGLPGLLAAIGGLLGWRRRLA